MPGPNSLVRSLSPLLRVGENREAFNLRKTENYGVDALQVCSINFLKSLLKCPAIITFVAASMKKRSVERRCGNRAWLAGSGFLISTGKPTEKATIRYLNKNTACVFHKFHIYFFLSVLDKYAYRRMVIHKFCIILKKIKIETNHN